MTLIFTPSTLTRYFPTGVYKASALLDLSETPFAGVPASVIGWLTTQLLEGERVSQVVLEDAGKVGVTFTTQEQETYDANGTLVTILIQIPETFRSVLSAAVSVSATLGERTFSISSESLPIELRDGLIAAWEYVNGLE